MSSKLGERRLIALVRSGLWSIDRRGRIWCEGKRVGNKHRGGVRIYSCKRQRVERQIHTGYLSVRAVFSGVSVHALAHRLVWQHFHGSIPAHLTINHLNGEKSDNRLKNLEVVSLSENIRHSFRTGLKEVIRGGAHENAKLSDAQVRQLRRRYAAGRSTQQQIADSFGVSSQTISRCIRGERYVNAGGPTRV